MVVFVFEFPRGPITVVFVFVAPLPLGPVTVVFVLVTLYLPTAAEWRVLTVTEVTLTGL